ncbi:7169_t:CDS:2, partial [Racocetra persica]
FIKPILDNIRQLQSEKIINTLEGEIWLIGRLGCITANLPQGNDLAGVLRYNANYSCRTCFVSSSQLTNSNFDFVANIHFHHLTNIQYNEIAQQQTNSARRQLSSQYGLSAKPVLDTLYWDRYLQSPQDAYHILAMLEKYQKTSKMVIDAKFANPSSFSDTLRLAMLIPFILCYFLSPLHLKAEIIEYLKELWVVEAKLLKLAFSTTITNDIYKELHSLFEKERIGFLKIFSDIFENLPNVHINVHLPQHARTFATLVNTSVRVKEIPKTRANIEGWLTKLSSQHPLFHDLHISYSKYFSLQSAFLNNKLEFFDYISYTIIENDRKSTQFKFHVGEIIKIEEESEDFTYAKIQAILQYQANNNESAIFLS